MSVRCNRDLDSSLEKFEDDQGGLTNIQHQIPIDERISMSRIPMDFESCVLKLMMKRRFNGRTRFRMAARYVISQVSETEQRRGNLVNLLI